MSVVQYIQHDAIDPIKWDHCIDQSPQGLIYAYTWYLNIMSPRWNALVLGDYDAVMPLTTRCKWGIHYLYQPAFCAELGVFFKDEMQSDIVRLFLDNIPPQYKYIDICLNRNNSTAITNDFLIPRNNFILSLSAEYADLQKNYTDNHSRNIKKAVNHHLTFHTDIHYEAAFQLIIASLKNIPSYSLKEWKQFEHLYQVAASKKSAICVGVTDAQSNLLSTVIFFHSHNTWFYLAAGTTNEGKKMGSAHFLVDSFIRLHAGSNTYLDFEGSDVPSVAFFYKGFGAENRPYTKMHINRLPVWVRWIKK